MKSAIVFNTYIGTSNQGDKIIYDSLYNELRPVLDHCFVVEYGTHVSNFTFYQYWRMRSKRHFIENADFKFVMGTNLLSYNLFLTRLQWMVGPISYPQYKGIIMAGVGTTQDRRELSKYSKLLYSKVLNKDYVHSARDEQSAELLRKVGVEAVNTGCPTLWMLDEEHCRQIPHKKARKVIFSLSGYADQKDPVFDQKMIEIIESNYVELFYWCQTIEDESYIRSLNTNKPYQVIYSLPHFGELLENGEIDYIGTRLHGGVFALRHKVRSIIVSIDQRARAFHESNNLPIIERDRIEELDEMINSKFETRIMLNRKNIDMWKNQFSGRGVQIPRASNLARY